MCFSSVLSQPVSLLVTLCFRLSVQRGVQLSVPRQCARHSEQQCTSTNNRPFPIPSLNTTAQGEVSRTCLMMAVSTETWDVHSNLSYQFFLYIKKKTNKQLLVTTTSSLKTLLNKVQAIAQNKTHGPDNPSHKDCSSRKSPNKRKKKP